jgi:hypothetical protein
MMTKQPERRGIRLPRGIPGWVPLILLFGVFWVGVEFVSRWFWAPWSFGEPSLTGTWDGPLQAGLGAPYRLLVDLDYRSVVRLGRGTFIGSSRPDTLQGTARLCTPRGETYTYAVRGRANRAGQEVRVTLQYGDRSLSVLDLVLVGGWSAPVLTLQPDRNPFNPDGTLSPRRAASSADPNDSFAPAELRTATVGEFEVVCGRLARS